MATADMTRTAGERLAALEASYQHVATKADIAELRADNAELRADIKNIKWLIGLAVIGSGALASIITLALQVAAQS